MNKIPMTASGYEEIQNELKKLLNEDRPNIIAAIAEARSHGDLSENAEYQYAKEQQSLIEGKIADLESAVGRAEVIDVKSIASEDIKFGATIEIEDDESGENFLYQIVGDYESDIKNKKFILTIVKKLIDLNFQIVATKGTAKFLNDHKLKVETINKVKEGGSHIVKAISNNMIDLVINTTKTQGSIRDSYSIRRTALTFNIPYYTTIAGAKVAVDTIEHLKNNNLKVKSLQDLI